MFKFILLAAVMGVIGYNVALYMRADGSMADKLSAAWKGSMTIFIGVWASILSLLTTGLDGLAAMTGDPMFGQWSDAVKAIIPPQWHPYIPLAGITAMMLARLRTAGK